MGTRQPCGQKMSTGDCNFLNKAIAIVTQATQADQRKEYEEAFRLYQLSLEYFMTALKYEKNKKVKDTIRAKTVEYMKRAEKLKAFLDKREKPQAAGGGGGGGGASDDKDDEKEKRNDALDQAIVREKPNVKWD